MKNLPLLIGTIIFTVLSIMGVTWLFSRPQENINQVIDQSELVGEARNATGSAQANIKVVEFSDFQCPACRSVQPLVKSVIATYADRIQFVYRHYPLLNIHPNAQLAAQAAESAAVDGKFWPMHDLLFTNQDEWASLGGQDLKEKFAEYAYQLQIDKTEFLKRIETEDIKQKVNSDLSDANKFKIKGTPTFFVNGIQTTAPELAKTIESLLSK